MTSLTDTTEPPRQEENSASGVFLASGRPTNRLETLLAGPAGPKETPEPSECLFARP